MYIIADERSTLVLTISKLSYSDHFLSSHLCIHTLNMTSSPKPVIWFDLIANFAQTLLGPMKTSLLNICQSACLIGCHGKKRTHRHVMGKWFLQTSLKWFYQIETKLHLEHPWKKFFLVACLSWMHIQLVIRRSQVRSQPGLATFFCGDLWNIFYSHSLPSGQMVSMPDCRARDPEFESHWRWSSAWYCMTLHYTEPFVITLPSSSRKHAYIKLFWPP